MRAFASYAASSLLLLSVAAHASDGVLEINQTCASTTGCFPGDAAGLPVTITVAAPARSFRLTSDLTTASGNQTMISVSAPSVALDLGGFRIVGPNSCSGVPVSSCTAPGVGIGVTGGNDVTVKNGAITGMGGAAISLTYSARVEGLNIFHCGGGIIVTDLAVIRGNVVTSSGGDGIQCRDYCAVSENSATGHLGDGIEVRAGTVNGNAASLNSGNGGRFVGRVAFGQNQFSGNTAGDVFGGHASAGNSCGDASCGARGARRFYMTTTLHNGSQAVGACAVGFHFASLWEIFDVAALEYDRVRGRSESDAGSGAISGVDAWIRTGASSAATGGDGLSNCNAWSTSSGDGTSIALDPLWDNGNTPFGSDLPPWIPLQEACSTPNPVWCVED